MNIDTLLFTFSLLVIISILIAKAFKNAGVPILLLFLIVGMLAGSEGPGKIFFDDAQLAQSIGIISLVLILFAGGLETKWKLASPILYSAISLSTFGVIITTSVVGIFIHYVLHMSFLISLLLGAVVASTDAAAIFSVMSFRNLNLKNNIKSLLELESGTNDPMAVFLTISLIQLINIQNTSLWTIAGLFVMQMCIGVLIGLGGGNLMVWMVNKLKFPIEGFYPVFVLAFALLMYAFTALLNGSGFLAVYVAGVIISNRQIVYKKNLLRFFDGLSWLAQIIMFITLGLLVFPSQVIPVIATGIVTSLFLIFIARPLGVFISLAFSKFNWKDKLLISWSGLRGAVPIILATFPLLAGVKEAGWIFNVVFFIVISSALLQGWTIPSVAKLLNLDIPVEKIKSPIEFSHPEEINMTLINLKVPDKSSVIKRTLVEIPELKGSLIVTIFRHGNYIVPSGGTALEAGDRIQLLTQRNNASALYGFFSE